MIRKASAGFLQSTRDLSERKEQQAKVLLRDRAIESLDDGVSITDARQSHYPLVYVNEALCKQTGYEANELLGQGVRILERKNSKQPEHLKLQEAQARGEAVQVLLNSTRKDGSSYRNELALSPVHNDAGEVTHYIGISRDVTKKLDTEARLHQARKIEAIGQLSSGIARDFNNLLNIVGGSLEFLDGDLSVTERREHLEDASVALQMGKRLTRRLLSFARQGTLEPTIVDLNEQVISAGELLQAAIGETISISTKIHPELWRTRTDPSEIENTVVNLATNARDAMPEGGSIFIETANVKHTIEDAEIKPGLTPGDYVRLSIADNGTGMTPEVKAHIFEPFYSTKGPNKGTGLGLASIYGFAKQSGGHVTVYSEEGHGTTVRVYLPRYKGEGVSANNESVSATPVVEALIKGARVLVVEDNMQVLKLTTRRLTALGFNVVQAVNGVEAISTLQSDAKIDLVFTDMVMAGGVSGAEVARWVKANMPECRVLLTSGFNEQIADAGEASIDGFKLLQKPYQLAELQAALDSVFGESREK